MWSLNRDSGLVWTSWGEEHILFQSSSGETHYLNATAASVLRGLSQAPGALDDVCRQTEISGGTSPDEGLLRQVAALLARFDELGIIERTEPLGDA